jgi:hypothetical protein
VSRRSKILAASFAFMFSYMMTRFLKRAASPSWYWLYDRTGKREKGPLGDFDGEEAVREAIDAAGLCER